MPVQLPYLSSYKNVPTIFEKIAAAKVPETFTHNFLQNTLGLKNTSDRPLIPFLRSLGFIDNSGKPTSEYNLLKGAATQDRDRRRHPQGLPSDIQILMKMHGNIRAKSSAASSPRLLGQMRT